jgi:hypothetical protein
MPVLLRWPSLPCHRDDTGMSTTKTSPSRSVTYKGYKECILGPRASRRFPLWMLHPPDEKLVRKPASSSCPTEMSDRVSSGTCRTSWSTIVEPPGRLSSTVPMPMNAQCCEAYGIESSNCIRPELCSKWSYVVRSTRIEEPAGGILRRKKNFCFDRAFHVEDVRIILQSNSDCAT